MRSEVKVGLLLVVTLGVLIAGITLLGKQSNLFRSKNSYTIRFETASGLNTGNPVQLNGVDVGEVKRVILPRDPSESEIVVWVAIDNRYEMRIRKDSQARIKTLGLLGDKYVEITSGSPGQPVIPDGGLIHTAPATSVDELLASGEDVMDNITAVTVSLREILERAQKGEGLLGELTTESGSGEKLVDAVTDTLDSIREAANRINEGHGPLARLLNDEEMGNRMEGSLDRLDRILAQVESGEGLLPSLLDDPEGKERFDRILARLDRTTAGLETLTHDLNNKHGLLQKLLRDEAYAKRVSSDLEELLTRLNTLSAKMTEGNGTVARLLSDPEIYQSLNDILIGIDESWMLRWLIRNRQKAGIESRFEEQRNEGDSGEGKRP
jgi:phospholipid/cholesterol/gamma-HCH transport system substrate-binding protein